MYRGHNVHILNNILAASSILQTTAKCHLHIVKDEKKELLRRNHLPVNI